MSHSGAPGKSVRPAAEVDDALVAAHLAAHPNFLRRHPQLVEVLEIPHDTGAAVSLVERQAAALRERNAALRARLDAVIAAAEVNDALYAKLLALAGDLAAARTLAEVARSVLAALREAYGAEHAALELFGRAGETLPEGARTGADPQPYAAVMAAPGSACLTAPSARQHAATFGVAPESLGSAALLPLRGAGPLGVLLLGSADPRRFDPALGTVFLDRFAALVGRHLAARLGAA